MGYKEIAEKVDIAIRHSEKPCVGGECDGETDCKRHNRTADIVFRYLRRKAK